jgi:hypothetical protein
MSTRKTRSDSKLDNLPQNQRETLERWLFDDSPRLSCAEAASRLHDDFNVRSSETAVRSFYKRARQSRLEEQALESIVADAKSANLVLEKSEQNAANFQRAIQELTSRMALKRALAGEDELSLEDIAQLSAMVLGGKKEDREERKLSMQIEKLNLERAKFEFSAAEACLAKLPELKTISGNSKLSQEDKITAIRRALFGQLPEDSSQKETKGA